MNCSAPVVVSAVEPKESRVKKVDFQRGIDMMRPLDTQTVVPGHFNRFYKLPQTSIRWDANVGDCQSSSFGGNAYFENLRNKKFPWQPLSSNSKVGTTLLVFDSDAPGCTKKASRGALEGMKILHIDHVGSPKP